jgi:DNA-binding MarR family transcriptional regulator
MTRELMIYHALRRKAETRRPSGYAAAVEPLFEFALSIKAVQRELERRINDAMQPLGLTAAQADAVVVIGQAEPLALKELGGLLIAESGHPSRLVDRLVEAGLVERRIPTGDRRRVELTLTREGHVLNKRILAAREQLSELARALLSDQDLTPALDVLRELVPHTGYAELVERRRQLADQPGGERPDAN